MAKGEIRIGLSGWSYRHWRGDFYPAGLPARAELGYALERFRTLELNRTFYSLVTPKVYRGWHKAAPRGFRWAVKGSRFITHNKKLGDVEEPLANFLASGVLELREKLGPVLWQLSPTWSLNLERLDEFLRLLPRTTTAAATIARRHTMPRREHATSSDRQRPLRHALELRHRSWFVPEVAALARKYRVALAFSHSSRWPYTEEVTGDFIYLRLHGPRQLYASAYTARELDRWAARIERWAAGSEPEDAKRLGEDAIPLQRRDVYVYFDNDGHGYAPRQATRLAELVGES